MSKAIRHRLTKTDNIKPLPKRTSKKATTKKSDDFDPKPVNEKALLINPKSLTPDVGVVFKAFLSARFCAALWSHISDCDETYNYWEPLHYLVYGNGMQTWEYSPEYALRSYTYILIHAVPAFLYDAFFKPKPMLVFYVVRCLLALMCALMETYFYKSICREFGVQIGRLWFIIQLFSAGMFVAGTALLPSTFSMYFGCAALAAWWHQRYPLAIFLVAMSTLLGWPFAALMGLPLCYDILVIQRKFKLFAFWSMVSGATILLPMIAIDSAYFGKLTVAPLNIITYNVFTSHGPDLYGTEPWTYYFINGFLNYNLIWLLALAMPVILGVAAWLIPSKTPSTLYLPYYLSLAPFYLWLLVFWVQAHKEERFLFPVYPMIALCGAISIDTIQKLFYRLRTHFKQLPSRSHYLDHTTWLAIVVLILSSVLGLSRITSLYFNYHAPMDLMIDLNHNLIEGSTEPVQMTGRPQNVCMGKDWYRFPGSFFLPSTDFRIRFVKSEFAGILPAYYAEGDNGTTLVHDYFNDMNRENPKMYSNYSDCHFMFDLEVSGSGTKLEPNYVQRVNDWTVAKQVPFLDAERSRGIYRSFYIPLISDRYVQYAQFNLLKSKKNKIK